MCLVCACAPRTLPLAGEGRESSVVLQSELAFPYRLISAVVLVDGEVVARSPGQVTLALAPGTHEVAFAASVSRPCELAGEQRERTRVRAAHSVVVSGPPVTIEASIVGGALETPSLEATVDGVQFSASVAERGCCGLAELSEPEPAAPPPAAPRDCRAASTLDVLVMGEVQHPREVKWRQGMTAYDAIASAGGATRLANLRYTVVRRQCGERLQVLELPWYASVSSLELQPGDDVIVRMTPDP